MKAIGVVVTVLVLMVYSSVLMGWALVKLWAWFIVPTFGAPILTIPAAIGVASVVSYLTHQINKGDGEEFAHAAIRQFLLATIKPMFYLAVGIVVKAFM